MKKVSSVPKGFHTVTPFLIVDGADEQIEFIKNAFGGELTFMQRDEKDLVMHATVRIGNSTIMISDTMDGMTPMNAMLFLYVNDVDNIFQKAVDAKGKVERELKDEFYGDRTGAIKDQWGNTWWIAMHIEDVSKEELERRAKDASKKMKEEMAH